MHSTNEIHDHICQWVQGFVDYTGQQEATRLLDGVGVVGYEG